MVGTMHLPNCTSQYRISSVLFDFIPTGETDGLYLFTYHSTVGPVWPTDLDDVIAPAASFGFVMAWLRWPLLDETMAILCLRCDNHALKIFVYLLAKLPWKWITIEHSAYYSFIINKQYLGTYFFHWILFIMLVFNLTSEKVI